MSIFQALSESCTKVSMQSIEKCVYYLNRLDSGNMEFERIKQNLYTMADNSKKTEDSPVDYQTYGHQVCAYTCYYTHTHFIENTISKTEKYEQ